MSQEICMFQWIKIKMKQDVWEDLVVIESLPAAFLVAE